MDSPQPTDMQTILEENARLKARIASLERERNNANLHRYLTAFYRSAANLLQHRSLDTLLQSIVEDMNDLVGTSHGVIYLGDSANHDNGHIIARAATGIFREYLGVSLKPNTGVSGRAFRTGEPLFVNTYKTWQEHHMDVADTVCAAVAFPMKSGDRVIGVIALGFLEPTEALDPSVMELLQGFAYLASICVENTRIYAELTETKYFKERLTATIPATIIIYDTSNSSPTYVNLSIQRILGYTREEILENSNVLASLIHPEDLPRIAKHMKYVFQLRDEDTAIEIEYRIRHKDGSWRYFASQDRVFDRNEDGTPAHILSLSHDVTEQHEAEAQLEASRRRFREIFDHAPMGIVIMEDNGDAILPNPTIEKMLGYEPGEIASVKRSLLTHPDDIPLERPYVEKVNRGEINGYQIEKRYLRKDHSVMWGRLTISKYGQRIIGIVEDITEKKATEQALIASENQLRAIFESAAMGIIVAERGGVIRRSNPAFAAMLGYELKEVIAANARDFTHPDDAAKEIEVLRRMAREHLKQVSMEKRYIRKNGSVMWARVWFSSFPSNKPEDTVGMAIVEDITERKQAEQALIESESRFRTIFNAAAVGIVLSDQHGNALEINPKFCAIVGYTPEELKQTHYSRLTHPDDLAIEDGQIQRLLSNEIQNFTIEKRFFAKDGHIVWARVWYSMFPNDNTRGVAIIEDVTERKIAEQTLLESEGRFRTLMETVPAVVFLYQGHQLVYINPAADHVLGVQALEIFENKLAEIVECYQKNPDLQANFHDVQLTLQDGQVFWLDLSLTTIELEGVPTILGTALDITARKQAEQHEIAYKLEQHRVNLLAEFVAHASHDFRTPLSTIKTSLYLVERLQDEERRQQRIQVIKEQVENLNLMLDNMLMLTRLDSSAYFNPGQTDVHEVMMTLQEKYASQAAAKSQQLDVTIPEDKIYLHADSSLLIQALSNFIDNAIRYTENEGKITVSYQITKTEAQFIVSDTGIGIPQEEHDKVFERFYRVDRARRYAGTGLGLTIVKKIAERHSGDVTLESTLDTGSTFVLTIPVKA